MFYFMLFVFAQYIYIVSVDQDLMCFDKFQSFLIFSNLPASIFRGKVEKQWQ